MLEEGLTLEDISTRTGVAQRTLRSWISEGLLAGPYKPGRGARYPETNVERALAVRALKEVHGRTFQEIGKFLMLADDEQVRDWAAEAAQMSPSLSSARDYLRKIRTGERDLFDGDPLAEKKRNLAQKKAGRSGPPRSNESTDPVMVESSSHVPKGWGPRGETYSEKEIAGIEALLDVLQASVKSAPPRRARGRAWYQIPITPDLHLSVRGELSPRERATLERVSDLVRAILTGGRTSDDET